MWQERAWRRHENREMAFCARASSSDRHWNGFEAVLYEASAGFSEQEFVRHNVSMQIGRPLLVTSRCNGETLRRLQVPGDVKIVPPGVTRVWETESATIKLSMYLSSTLILSTAEAMGIRAERVAISPQLHVRDPRIEHLGWAVKAELEAPEFLGRLYGDSLGIALATQLLRAYVPACAPSNQSKLSRRRLAHVFDYVRSNLGSDLCLAELAKTAGLSSSHFKTLFKQTVGMPVHQYVVRQRVEYAAELLQHGNSPIADVALAAGFSNQSHMARWMKRLTGATPQKLRG